MTAQPVPGLTVCGSCAGETLTGVVGARESQLAGYAAIEACGDARVTVVECLDRCGRGDVVVVRPAITTGAGSVWLAGLAGDQHTAALHGWLRSGGPDGTLRLPAALLPLVIDRAGGAERDSASRTAGLESGA